MSIVFNLEGWPWTANTFRLDSTFTAQVHHITTLQLPKVPHTGTPIIDGIFLTEKFANPGNKKPREKFAQVFT